MLISLYLFEVFINYLNKNRMSNYKSLGREIQFILPVLLSLFLFFIINVIGLFDIYELAYWSGKIYKEPLRIFLYSFVHVDFNHLLSNVFGIIIL